MYLLALASLLSGCDGSDTDIVVQRRALETDLLTFDAGTVAIDSQQTFTIYLASVGAGDVTVFDIYVEDEEDTFVVLDDWMLEDGDDDGVLDSQVIPGGSDLNPEYGKVEVSFRPTDEDYYRTTLVIVSNDNEVTEQDEEGHGIWKVTLRGVGRYPCARVYPDFVDFGPKTAGGFFYSSAYVENCGAVTLTVTNFAIAGDDSFWVETPVPLYVLPNGVEEIDIGWTPSAMPESDTPESATITTITDAPNTAPTIDVIGNDCESSTDRNWDGDGDGWSFCGDDCDDDDETVNPSAQEIAGNGVNEDCDGKIDEAANQPSRDNDGDGYTETEGDCRDNDSEVHPGATEVANNIDDDCDGKIDDHTSWYDDDRDGYSERAGDCRDGNPNVYPGAEENTGNEIDDDCDGLVDEGGYLYDDDLDGFVEFGADGQDDCADADPWSYPGAVEDCDTRDNDCDGVVDEGEDGTTNGACAFVITREEYVPPPTQCAAVSAAGSVVLALTGLALGAGRRREEDGW